MARPIKELEVNSEIKKVTPKYKIVSASEYYQKARELQDEYGVMNIRDLAIVLLHEEYGDKIVKDLNDVKSGEIKYLVKL